jgi:hypothetical protein
VTCNEARRRQERPHPDAVEFFLRPLAGPLDDARDLEGNLATGAATSAGVPTRPGSTIADDAGSGIASQEKK